MISKLLHAHLFGLAFFDWAMMNSTDLTWAFKENSNWLRFAPDQIIDSKSGDSQVIEILEQVVAMPPVLSPRLVLFD